ncbi:MAG: DUF3014 domain-containing protein [Chromatiales bacterium]|nr:DUF3014 domain-containing protein [Chromatiales bacterium]
MSTLLPRLLILLCVIAAGAVAWLYLSPAGVPLPEPEPAPVELPPADLVPDIRFPVPEPVPEPEPEADAEPAEPLPPLAESDEPVEAALAAVLGLEAVARWLVPQDFIRRVVIVIDDLPGMRATRPELRPMPPTPNTFRVTGDEEDRRLDPQNYGRYTPLVRLIEATDVRRVVAVYLRFYPLFQEAWEEIAPPGAYFNDRLVEVIDHLLETPELAVPPALVQPRVYFEYADPELEGRSAGQKLLMRMGPDHTRAIKRQLRVLRSAVIGQPG